MRWPRGDAPVIILSGLSLGFLGAALAFWGNPANSGICISCFMENLAGALHLHDDARMAYLRPELVGFVGGSLMMAFAGREFRSRSGKIPLLGFVMGIFLIVGSSVFMGCPIKMMLRLGAGDLTAVAGFLGLAAGVWAGVFFLRAGLDLGGVSPSRVPFQGLLLPGLFIIVLAVPFVFPGSLASSVTGPGARHAPLAVSLAAGVVIGALAQRSRFCVTGSFSNLYLARDMGLMRGLLALLVSAVGLNLALGMFHLGMLDQPGSHPDHFWNFLSMGMVGLGSVMVGGCPFRQLILSGEGSVDAAVVTLGMLTGGGIVHQWGIASTSAGPTPAGKAAVLLGLFFCLAIARFYGSGEVGMNKGVGAHR
ncbi:MAG: YedE-related selenium metabolism membrane protein [Deltaproteobacteria bacterium]|nr:YedE-related selenium metabolism membrane protein [Deltaproteobacteria bacterium]